MIKVMVLLPRYGEIPPGIWYNCILLIVDVDNITYPRSLLLRYHGKVALEEHACDAKQQFFNTFSIREVCFSPAFSKKVHAYISRPSIGMTVAPVTSSAASAYLSEVNVRHDPSLCAKGGNPSDSKSPCFTRRRNPYHVRSIYTKGSH